MVGVLGDEIDDTDNDEDDRLTATVSTKNHAKHATTVQYVSRVVTLTRWVPELMRQTWRVSRRLRSCHHSGTFRTKGRLFVPLPPQLTRSVEILPLTRERLLITSIQIFSWRTAMGLCVSARLEYVQRKRLTTYVSATVREEQIAKAHAAEVAKLKVSLYQASKSVSS